MEIPPGRISFCCNSGDEVRLARLPQPCGGDQAAIAAQLEALAKRRLADEYDAAQERGEVQKHGGQGNRDIPVRNIPSATVADMGLTSKEIHEARTIRDAEARDPGRGAAARSLGEGDYHIFSLTPHNVTGVRLPIGTDQQNKLIRNVGTRRDFDGGTGCRYISDCATDLSICKDDLTGLKTPNRGSAFMHGVCQSSASRQNYFSDRCSDTLIA
jgi:hypothetical protein